MARSIKGRKIGADARLAKSIREMREGHGMSRAGLAERMEQHGCPMPVSAIYKLEAEERTVKPDELVTLASIFRVSTDFLLGSSDDGPLPHRLQKVISDCRNSVFALSAMEEERNQAQEALDSQKLGMLLQRAKLGSLPIADRQKLRQSGEMPTFFLDALEVPEEGT